MTDVVLVHGAFRGAWAMEPLAAALRHRGIAAHAPDLPNAGRNHRPDHEVVGLDAAVAALRDVVEAAATPVALIGHSQGGLVVRALLADPDVDRLVRVVGYLEAAVPEAGECAAELLGGSTAVTQQVRSALIAPPPADECLPSALRRLARRHATPQHAAMAFDPVGPDRFTGPIAWAFATGSSPDHPSAHVRARLDRAGTAYHLIEGCHDLPLHRPDAVADWVAGMPAH